jgi:hypothetical protein
MREIFFDDMKANVKVSVIQKKKKKWVATSSILTAEGETEELAILALIKELKLLVNLLTEIHEDE